MNAAPVDCRRLAPPGAGGTSYRAGGATFLPDAASHSVGCQQLQYHRRCTQGLQCRWSLLLLQGCPRTWMLSRAGGRGCLNGGKAGNPLRSSSRWREGGTRARMHHPEGGPVHPCPGPAVHLPSGQSCAAFLFLLVCPLCAASNANHRMLEEEVLPCPGLGVLHLLH